VTRNSLAGSLSRCATCPSCSMTTRQPPDLAGEWLTIDKAAAYIGLSPSGFHGLVVIEDLEVRRPWKPHRRPTSRSRRLPRTGPHPARYGQGSERQQGPLRGPRTVRSGMSTVTCPASPKSNVSTSLREVLHCHDGSPRRQRSFGWPESFEQAPVDQPAKENV
jgi:hypothetical protein